MTDDFLDLDHLMVHVADSEAAGAVFERLGFVATPKSGMPGLSNRLLCFADTASDAGICNYIELMQLEDADLAPQPVPRFLIDYGPASMVLCADDPAAVRERLATGGMTLSPALELSREWALPSGEVLTAAFAVAIPEPGQAPFYWNFCKHRTARHYVRSDFTGHPNGARRFTEVIAVADDPAATAEPYLAQWKATFEDGRVRLLEGRVTLALHEPKRFAEMFASVPGLDVRPGLKGFRVTVADLDRARKLMEDAGIATWPVASGFAVAPADAAETLVIFEGSDAARD